MPPQGELARADLVPGCPRRRSEQRGTRSVRATPSSFYSLFVSERRTLRIDRAAIARRPGSISSFHRSHWGHPPPWGRAEGGHMWIHKVVLEACPICSKETTLAGVEPHPTHPETELHTYRCVDCGLVKTRSIRSRSGRLLRASGIRRRAFELTDGPG